MGKEDSKDYDNTGILKEIKDFYKFFWRTSKKEKRIVFYSENEGYYSYLEGLIKELTDKQGQTLCYITSDKNDKILQTKNPKIKTFFLDKLLPFFMSLVNCKVFVMTLTDLNKFHLKRSIKPVHYVYVFHSLVSTHMIYRTGSFDHYDSILCVGPHQPKEIRAYEEINNLPQKKLLKTGYYRLERIYKNYQDYLRHKNLQTKKTTVLVAPSWGEHQILKCCGEELVHTLLEKNYKVIVRPHPETVKQDFELLNQLQSKFNNNPDFTLELSVATDDSMLEADVLISDYSGISLEYAFGTERPVLFFEVLPKVKNPEYKDLGIEPIELSLRSKIGMILKPEEYKKVPAIISELINNKEKYKENIVKLREQIIYNFGKSSEIGAQYIIKLANN